MQTVQSTTLEDMELGISKSKIKYGVRREKNLCFSEGGTLFKGSSSSLILSTYKSAILISPLLAVALAVGPYRDDNFGAQHYY